MLVWANIQITQSTELSRYDTKEGEAGDNECGK